HAADSDLPRSGAALRRGPRPGAAARLRARPGRDGRAVQRGERAGPAAGRVQLAGVGGGDARSVGPGVGRRVRQGPVARAPARRAAPGRGSRAQAPPPPPVPPLPPVPTRPVRPQPATPRLRYRELPQLPRLAWLAVLNRDTGDVLVYHGSALECREHWMVEGTWDGDFQPGGFHESDHFFGSGIRVVDHAVHFVPSSAPVNGLFCGERRRELLVSNSLMLLLGFTGARLDPDHDYRAETYAIRQGAERYRRDFTVLHPEIPAFSQVYDRSLVALPGESGIEFASPRSAIPVPSYARYRELVAGALQRLRANYTSPDRRVPLGAFATISSGYDSAAAAVLVKDLPIEACFTSRRSNTHIPVWLNRRAGIDDGTPIADRLGLTTIPLDPRGSRVTEDELYFLAPG